MVIEVREYRLDRCGHTWTIPSYRDTIDDPGPPESYQGPGSCALCGEFGNIYFVRRV